MSTEKDLETFRTDWRKELKDKTQFAVDSKSKESSSSFKSEDKTEILSLAENSLGPSLGGNNITLKKASTLEDDFLDDTSADGFPSDEKGEQIKNPLYNYNESTDSCEYYPFRILTQFLNEAPKKAKTSQRVLKQQQQSPGETYSKRKYFQSASSQQKSKISKMDSCVTKSVKTNKSSQRMLDLFLADLDDINEIPFFDSTLPREVAVKIFEYLDMSALCKCAQVSRSWRSLADDEHLWCTICHRLGHQGNTRVGDFSNWKTRVQDFVEEKHLLESNWKARVGRPYNLSNAKGGVLCALHSYKSTIVAGYSNCSVKSWNTLTGDSCTYGASDTSMVIDESTEDLGTINNEIRDLKTTAQITAASFRHGFIDVWWNDCGTEPVHTITFNRPDVSSMCVDDVDKNRSVVASSQRSRVHVSLVEEDSGRMLGDFNMHNPVSHLRWLQAVHQSDSKPRLLISDTDSVWLKEFNPDSQTPLIPNMSQSDANLTEIHSIIMAPVTCTATREKSVEVGVGFNMITGPSVQIKVNVYDVEVGRLKSSLTGHTWLISSMHMPQGLDHRLVTGSGDRKVRLFDTQAQTTPVLTLAGHSAKVTCVQMDEIKVVTGDEAGFVRVWDQRMGRKLWDIHNRHPVQYCHFDGRLLIIGNVPYQKFPEKDEFESVSSLRYRGTVQFYDFLANQQRPGIPEICLSSYNEPEASISNLGLAVPYDSF